MPGCGRKVQTQKDTTVLRWASKGQMSYAGQDRVRLGSQGSFLKEKPRIVRTRDEAGKEVGDPSGTLILSMELETQSDWRKRGRMSRTPEVILVSQASAIV